MNLADLLCYADIHQLNRIAKRYQCECDGHSKNELIQSILYSALRQDHFQQHIDELEREDVQFIHSLIFDNRDVFSLEELMARAKQALIRGDEDRSPREMITNLTQKGWLFNGISHQTKMLFQIPADVKRKMLEAFKYRFTAGLQPYPEPEFYRDEQGLLREDIFIFLRYVSANDILLTNDGGIYKRQQQLILDQMNVKEEPIRDRAWRFGYGRRFKDYPDRLSFIYDYCYFSEYLKEEGMKLTLTPSGEMKVAERKLDDMAEIYRFWLRLYRGPIRNLQVLVRLIDLTADRWVSLQAIQPMLTMYIKDYYYDNAQSILEKRIVQLMFHLGLLRIGQSWEGETLVRVTEAGHKLIHGIEIEEREIIDLNKNQPEPEFRL